MSAKPLTDERLAEIAARAEAATAGPWGLCDDGTGLIDIAADLEDTGHGYRCRRYVGQLEADQIDNDPAHRDWTEEQDRAQVAADAEFVAHAREDVSALLDEILRLCRELAHAVPHARELALKDAARWMSWEDSPDAAFDRIHEAAQAAQRQANAALDKAVAR